MRFSRSGMPISGSPLSSLRGDRTSGLMRRRHAIYEYEPKNSNHTNYHAANEPLTQQDLIRLRSRLLRFILENQRQREVLEQRGFSSQLSDVYDRSLER